LIYQLYYKTYCYLTKGEMTHMAQTNVVIQTIILGSLSAILIFLFYYFEAPILDWTKQGGWYFIIPIIIAFIFSFVHALFVSHFWDVLGVKAKLVKE